MMLTVFAKHSKTRCRTLLGDRHEDLLAHCLELHYVLQECLGLKKKRKRAPSPGTIHTNERNESLPQQQADVNAQPQPAMSLTDVFAKEEEESAIPAALLSGSNSPQHVELYREVSDSNIITARLTERFRKGEDPDGMKVINDKYVVLQELGRGSCAKVKLAYDQEAKKLVAMKIVRRPPTIVNALSGDCEKLGDIRGNARPVNMKFQALACEIAVMKKLRHNNIVSLLEVIDDPSAQKMYLIMKYIDKGPIGKVHTTALTCTKIDPVELIGYARQMVAGLHYLHDRGIIHRDLKPENILIDSDKQVYLADFGVSETLELEEERSTQFAAKLHSSVISNVSESYVVIDQPAEKTKQDVESRRGTLLFLPPEILAQGIGDGFAVDMWSLGITLYALLVGELPFKREEEILHAKISYPDYIGPLWRQALRHLLAKNPKKRLTIGELRCFLHAVEKGARSVPGERPISEDAQKDSQRLKSVHEKDQSVHEKSATIAFHSVKRVLSPKPPTQGTPSSSPHRVVSKSRALVEERMTTDVGSDDLDQLLVPVPVGRSNDNGPPLKNDLPSDSEESSDGDTTGIVHPIFMPYTTSVVSTENAPPRQQRSNVDLVVDAKQKKDVRSNVRRMVEQAARKATSKKESTPSELEFSDEEELNTMGDPPVIFPNTGEKLQSKLTNNAVFAPFVVLNSKSNVLKSVARHSSKMDGGGVKSDALSVISTTGRMAPVTNADISTAITACTSTYGGSLLEHRRGTYRQSAERLLDLVSHDEYEDVVASQRAESRVSVLSFGGVQPPLPVFAMLGSATQSKGLVQKPTMHAPSEQMSDSSRCAARKIQFELPGVHLWGLTKDGIVPLEEVGGSPRRQHSNSPVKTATEPPTPQHAPPEDSREHSLASD